MREAAFVKQNSKTKTLHIESIIHLNLFIVYLGHNFLNPLVAINLYYEKLFSVYPAFFFFYNDRTNSDRKI